MTVALVANIARPISSAISTAFSADSYGLLSSYGLLGASASPDAVIEALFANSEVGAWYDPSDLSTMFKDSAGTTPVTADGQTVGLILDKSKGLVLGPELVTNGDFSNGTTGWLALGTASISASSGGLLLNAGTTPNYTAGFKENGTFTPVVGKTYKITLIYSAPVSYSRVRLVLGDAQAYTPSATTSPTTFICYLNPISSNTLFVYADTIVSNEEFLIDNISVKELAGNHASQATDASRPLYKTDGTYSWLQFDGVDDSLSTAAIDFTSTDKMSVFNGINVTQTTSTATICVLGGKYTTTGFIQQCPFAPGNSYISFDIGGASGSLNRPTSSLNRAVVSFVMDRAGVQISEEHVADRVNGAAVVNVFSGTPVTGYFGNLKFYLSNVSEFFNGAIYGTILLGRQATTQEITDTETWVNSKTGAF